MPDPPRALGLVAGAWSVQFVPFHVIDQVISIFAGSKGFMDDLPVSSVREFEKGLLEYMRGVGKPVRDELEQKKDIKAVEKKLEEAIRAFKSMFKPSKA